MNDWIMLAYYNWPNWSHLQRMNFLRSLRLSIIEEKNREKREQARREYLLEKWLKEGKC